MGLILSIDDSSFQRKRIKEALEALGHQVVEAVNGRDGLEKAKTQTPACIFCDLLMPEMDGFEFLKAFKETGLSIPVVILTANVQTTTKHECMELGASYFLTKPLNATELQHTLGNIFSGKDKA